MLSRILAAAMCLLPLNAFADAWVYDFSFGYKVTASRLMLADCQKVVPLHYVQFYAGDPRPGWTVNCGGDNPIYTHFLGRRCAKPLPRLTFECGWQHMSHAFDGTEMTFDAFAVRGRFTWGKP